MCTCRMLSDLISCANTSSVLLRWFSLSCTYLIAPVTTPPFVVKSILNLYPSLSWANAKRNIRLNAFLILHSYPRQCYNCGVGVSDEVDVSKPMRHYTIHKGDMLCEKCSKKHYLLRDEK